MAKEKLDVDKVTALAKKLYRSYFAGDMEPWFSHLCNESIWLGNNEPMLFGGDAIRNHFKSMQGVKIRVRDAEYYSTRLSDDTVKICGRFVLGDHTHDYRTITWFTLIFREISGEIKLVHQHHSYEHIREKDGRDEWLELDQKSMNFVKRLLLERPRQKRIQVPSGRQTVFINPYSLLYVQSRGKRTEFVCTDRVISCSSSISEAAGLLPKEFYPIHRSFLVNTSYIVAVRRFEAELFNGVTIPIPAQTYMQVKADLAQMLDG